MLARDISNWTPELDTDTLARWRDAGTSLVIVQAIDTAARPGLTRRQIGQVLEAGMSAGVYVWGTFGQRGLLAARLSLADGLPLHQIYLDMEDAEAAATLALPDRIEWAAAALELCDTYPAHDRRAGIYSGRGFWWQWMGDTARFADRDLWDASYLQRTGEDAQQGFVPYGGWRRRAMWQCADRDDIAGLAGTDADVLSTDEAAQVAGIGEVVDVDAALAAEYEARIAGLATAVAELADNVVDAAAAARTKTARAAAVSQAQAIRVQFVGPRPTA